MGAGRPEKRNEKGAIGAIYTRMLCFRLLLLLSGGSYIILCMHTSRAVLRFPPGAFVHGHCIAIEIPPTHPGGEVSLAPPDCPKRLCRQSRATIVCVVFISHPIRY